jgi:predicted lipid-binding transport protein (Tim44 family)
MNKHLSTILVTILSMGLVLATGCVNPDGTQNNTGTGAIVGGMVGAFAGAATSGRHGGQNTLIGAAIGAASGAVIGSLMDLDQRRRLREESPRTYVVVQRNQQLAAQPPAASSNSAPPPAAGAATPLKVSDITALTAAGVKPDAIIQAIKESDARYYSAADIAAARRSSPPVDPAVIAYMRNPTG